MAKPHILDGRLISVPPSVSGDFVLDNSVDTITPSAFSSCDKITSLTLSSRILRLNKGDLTGLKQCKKLIFPKPPLMFDPAIRADLPALEEIRILQEDKRYKTIDGILYRDDSLILYPPAKAGTNFTVPDGTTAVMENAMAGAAHLKHLNLNQTVTLRKQALQGAANLESVDFGNSLKQIGDQAFYNCRLLEEAVFPDTLSRIGQEAFKNCESLRKVTFGNGTTDLMTGAFSYCLSLTSFDFPELEFCGPAILEGCRSLTSVGISSTLYETDALLHPIRDNARFEETNPLPSYTGWAGNWDPDPYEIYEFKNLEEVRVHPDNRVFYADEGILFTHDGHEMILYPDAKKEENVTLKEPAESIGQGALRSPEHLKKLTLPLSIRKAAIPPDLLKTVTVTLPAFPRHSGLTDYHLAGFLDFDHLDETDLSYMMQNSYSEYWRGYVKLFCLAHPEMIEPALRLVYERIRGLQSLGAQEAENLGVVLTAFRCMIPADLQRALRYRTSLFNYKKNEPEAVALPEGIPPYADALFMLSRKGRQIHDRLKKQSSLTSLQRALMTYALTEYEDQGNLPRIKGINDIVQGAQLYLVPSADKAASLCDHKLLVKTAEEIAPRAWYRYADEPEIAAALRKLRDRESAELTAARLDPMLSDCPSALLYYNSLYLDDAYAALRGSTPLRLRLEAAPDYPATHKQILKDGLYTDWVSGRMIKAYDLEKALQDPVFVKAAEQLIFTDSEKSFILRKGSFYDPTGEKVSEFGNELRLFSGIDGDPGQREAWQSLTIKSAFDQLKDDPVDFNALPANRYDGIVIPVIELEKHRADGIRKNSESYSTRTYLFEGLILEIHDDTLSQLKKEKRRETRLGTLRSFERCRQSARLINVLDDLTAYERLLRLDRSALKYAASLDRRQADAVIEAAMKKQDGIFLAEFLQRFGRTGPESDLDL